MIALSATAPKALFPPLVAATIVTSLMAGIAADITWEVWARVVTPIWVGGPLDPAALIQSVFPFIESRGLAEIIHLVVGFVFYPLGYLYIARPLQRAILPGLPPILLDIGYGIGLFIFALYIMAHLIAGLPPFLDWHDIAFASLIGHILFGIVVGLVVRWREGRAA